MIWVDSLVERVANFPNTWPIITRATYARIYIPEVLPDVERALYLDCDVLARRNVGELFHAEMNGYWALASPDVQAPFVPFGVPNWHAAGRSAGDLNFNAGVLLMDLDAWRREGLTESLLRYLTDGRHLRAQDQEAINAVLGCRIGEMDPRWNQQAEIFWEGIQYHYEAFLPYTCECLAEIRRRSVDDPLLEPPEALALRLPPSLPRRVVRGPGPDRLRRMATDRAEQGPARRAPVESAPRTRQARRLAHRI